MFIPLFLVVSGLAFSFGTSDTFNDLQATSLLSDDNLDSFRANFELKHRSVRQINPCNKKRCRPGTICRLEYPLCFTSPCPPQAAAAQCIPTCATLQCPRDTDCVDPGQCPKPEPYSSSPLPCSIWPKCVPKNPCLQKICRGGTFCVAQTAPCRNKPCPQLGVCIKPPTCADMKEKCSYGKHCEMRLPPCADGVPCYPMPNCIDDHRTNFCAPNSCRPGHICKVIHNEIHCIPLAINPCTTKLCPQNTHCVATAPCPSCVPSAVCVPKNLPTCAAILCEEGSECQIKDGVASCVPVGCAGSNCPPGTHCISEYPKCPSISTSSVKPPYACPPVSRCIADINPCMFAKCASGVCNVVLPENCVGASCQPTASCSPAPLAPCERQYCPPGSHCEKMDTYCTRTVDGNPVSVPCNTLGTCVADYNPCATVRCMRGHTCRPKNVVCVRAPCLPIAECVPDACLDIKCSIGNRCVLAPVPCMLPIGEPTESIQCPDPVPICSPDPDPCQTIQCPLDTVCQIKTKVCIPPCPPEPECVIPQCQGFNCQIGTHCELRPYPCAPGQMCIQIVVPTCVPNQDPCDQCGPGTSCVYNKNVNCVSKASCLPDGSCTDSCPPSVQCVPETCSEITCPPGEVCKSPGYPCEMPCVATTGCYSSSLKG